MSRHELVAAAITDPQLQAGYEAARRLNADHGRTYYLATLLLPPAKRPSVHALYGFARHADDIVDQLDPALTAAQRAAQFDAWSAQVAIDLDRGASSDPISHALIDTLDRWQIPVGYINEFLGSMRMDLTVTEYETDADLGAYMRGSAAVIGLQMLPILGRANASINIDELSARASELGVAFQLTNFLRDIAEDLHRGRIYLPQQSLRRFGVDRGRLERAVAERSPDDSVRSLIAFEIDRTRAIYVSAERGLALVHPSSRPCLRTALRLYEAILGGIERADYNVFSRRVTVGRTRRVWVGGRGLIAARFARRPSHTHVDSVSNTNAKPNSTSSTGA